MVAPLRMPRRVGGLRPDARRRMARRSCVESATSRRATAMPICNAARPTGFVGCGNLRGDAVIGEFPMTTWRDRRTISWLRSVLDAPLDRVTHELSRPLAQAELLLDVRVIRLDRLDAQVQRRRRSGGCRCRGRSAGTPRARDRSGSAAASRRRRAGAGRSGRAAGSPSGR